MSKNKKVLHIYFLEGNLGDAIRINEMGKWLSKNSLYRKLNIADYKKKLFTLSNLWVALKALLKAEPIETIKNRLFVEHCKKIIEKKLKKNNYDLIISEIIPIGLSVILATPRAKKIVDVHGLAASEYKENKYQERNKKHYRYLLEMEKGVFSKSDALICVSKRMKSYIKNTYRVKSKIFVAQNGTTTTTKRAHFNSPLKIIYGGIFAFWEDVDTFLDLAKKDTQNKYYLMGDGPEKERILSRITKEGIKMKYLGRKKRKEAHEIFSKMNVGLSPTSTGLTRKVASPIKVYDYMSIGLPVVTAVCGDWGEQIAKYDAGYVCKKSQGVYFLKAIKNLEKESVWQRKSKNAIILAQKKTWCNILNKKLRRLFYL